MVVKGFHIRKNGTCVPKYYGSHPERLYCEASELLEHKFYAHAREKLDEYLEIGNERRLLSCHEFKFILQVMVGYLNVERTEKNIKDSADIWIMAASSGGGDSPPPAEPTKFGPCSEMVQYAFEIVDHFKELNGMPTESFDDLTYFMVKQTIDLLDFIIKFFVVPSAQRGGPKFQNGDNFLCPVQSGIRHLIEVGEKKQAKEFYSRVASIGEYAPFIKQTITDHFDDVNSAKEFYRKAMSAGRSYEECTAVMKDTITDLNADTIVYLDFIVDYFVVPKDTVDFRLPIQNGIRHLIEHGERETAREIYSRIIDSGYVKYVAFMQEGEYQW